MVDWSVKSKSGINDQTPQPPSPLSNLLQVQSGKSGVWKCPWLLSYNAEKIHFTEGLQPFRKLHLTGKKIHFNSLCCSKVTLVMYLVSGPEGPSPTQLAGLLHGSLEEEEATDGVTEKTNKENVL